MATSGPQAIARKANGVLPISASGDAPKSNKSKAQSDADKVIIRRLPPGLTEEEFWKFLGEEWKAGNGLVDWANFEPGKVSQDPAKTSRPGRAYLHVMKRESLDTLAEAVQTIAWEDAKYTFNSPALVGPPVLEIAIYKKVPGGKKRSDARQGTIDQDPEFMAFLHSLTNPDHSKDAENGDEKSAADEAAKSDSKVTTTPLIEYLREKKANKAKEAANAKSAKHARQESQGGKTKGSSSSPEESKKKSKESKAEKGADKPRETVKILTKKAAADAAKAAEAVANQILAGSQDVPKSRRAGIAAAARLLQRDLGLSPGSAHRKARLDAAKAEADAKTTTKETPTSTKETKDSPSSASSGTPSAPATTATPAASERPSTPTAPKSGRSRRGGGGKTATTSDAKGKAAEMSGGSSGTSAPSAAPVVLLKKKNENPPAQAAASPTTAQSTSTSTAKATPPTGPKSVAKAAASSSSSQKKPSPAVTPGALRGFVKHANPSQGVTEATLKQTLQVFGTITFVEIDKRKGFAYVDFAEHEGLAKAIGASPIPVAQGTVQVLERKDKKPAATPAAAPAASAPASSAATGSTSTPTEKGESQKRTRRGRGGKTAATAAAATGGSGASASNAAAQSTPTTPVGAAAGTG